MPSNSCRFGLHSISVINKNDQNLDPFQSETPPAGREREGRLLDLSDPAKECQCEAPVARPDAGGRHYQWRFVSIRARSGRPEKSLAQSGPEAERSRGRGGRGRRCARDHTGGQGTGTRSTRRSEKSSRGTPHTKARKLWSDITTNARRDWIHWITSAKQPETRARRIKNACSMLAAGKRRVCCFDRSGFYSKSMSAPKAAI